MENQTIQDNDEVDKRFYEAEFNLFSILTGFVIGFSIEFFYTEIFQNFSLEVIATIGFNFFFAIVVIIDYYIQWWKYIEKYPPKSFKWGSINYFWAFFAAGLYVNASEPVIFLLLLSVWWLCDFASEIRIVIQYKELLIKNNEYGEIKFYVFTDILYFILTLVMAFIADLYMDYSVLIMIISFLGFCFVRYLGDDFLLRIFFERKRNVAE